MLNAAQKRYPGSIRILCEAAPGFGVTAEQCLAGTGLVTFDLYGSETTVTLAQEIAAITNFLAHAPARPGLGIEIGRRYRPEVFGIWGYAILSSPTFRAALKTAIDFGNLSFVIAALGLDESGDLPRLTFDTTGLSPEIAAFVLQRHLTVVVNFSAELLPRYPLSKFTVETQLTDPAFAAPIEEMLGLTVRLGADRDAIVLSGNILDRPLPRHDPAVMEHCLRQCRSLLNLEEDALPEWTAKVREAVLFEIGNDPGIISIAAKLGITERTLRRRLAAEGANFRDILGEARLAIAHELLASAGLNVSTVAWRTGYSEPSSFVRAFTKHYGYSPGSVKNRPAVRA